MAREDFVEGTIPPDHMPDDVSVVLLRQLFMEVVADNDGLSAGFWGLSTTRARRHPWSLLCSVCCCWLILLLALANIVVVVVFVVVVVSKAGIFS